MRFDISFLKYLFLMLIIYSCSLLSKDRNNLLIKLNENYFEGKAFIPTKNKIPLEIKIPPTKGILRIIGEKNIVLPSTQFLYDKKNFFLFWKNKKIYKPYIPVILTNTEDLSIYKIIAMGQDIGFQEATIYLYNPESFKTEFEMNCNNVTLGYRGIGHCEQFENSEFSIFILNKTAKVSQVSEVECDNEVKFYRVEPNSKLEIKKKILGCQILYEINGQNILIFTFLKSKDSKLPLPERNGKMVRIGLNTTLVQCGNKVVHTKKATDILKISKSCYNKPIYQYSNTGKFLFTP